MGLFKELFRLRRYKVSQGRLIRRLTMAGVLSLPALATGLVCAQETSRELMDEIRTYLRVPVENRDFPAILEKTERLCELHPESSAADLMLHTIERWHSISDISDRQFEPFRKRLQTMRQQEATERVVAQNIEGLYARFMSVDNSTVQDGQDVVDACLRVLGEQNVSRSLRCSILVLLAEVSFEMQQFDEFRKYADILLEEGRTSEGLYFLEEAGFVRRVRVMELNRELDISGMQAAVEFWRSHFVLQVDSNDDSLLRLDRVISNYGLMSGLLNMRRSTYKSMGDSEKYDIATDLMISVLEDMVKNFPDSNHIGLLEGRLQLGYLVLNRSSSSPGMLSGIMTSERINKINLMQKMDAEKAEQLFLELRELAEGTSYEQHVIKALENVERVKNPKLFAVESDKFVLDTASYTWHFGVLMFASALFLVWLLTHMFVRRLQKNKTNI